MPITSSPVTRQHWEEPDSVFFTPSHQVFILMDKVSKHLFFSRLSILNSLNPCLYDRCSSPLVISVGCCWTLVYTLSIVV